MSLEVYKSLLETCSGTGSIDYERWPAILPHLLDRLSHIAHNDFPIPKPQPVVNPVLPSQLAAQPTSHPSRFIANPPILPSSTPKTPRTLPPVPPFPGSSASRVPDSQPESGNAAKDTGDKGKLPLQVYQLLEQCLATLRTSFQETPPHTIQRLSELALYPRKHYRTLPAWLRALDRVVSVSSGAEIFPLSDIPPNLGITNGVTNGTDVGGILFPSSSNDVRNGYDRDALGSDESLGGALLTPIPWLKDSDLSSGTEPSTVDPSSKIESWRDGTENLEDDLIPLPDPGAPMSVTDNFAADAAAIQEVVNGHSNFVPERNGGAVTQGELIRMEQQAGIVPVPHEDIHRVGDEGSQVEDDGDNMPHARGPDLVGAVDLGKVEGQERQIRISSPPEQRVGGIDANNAQEVLVGGQHKPEQTEESVGDSDDFVQVEKDDESKKALSDDGDIVLVDADGVVEDAAPEKKADESGVDVGADAADSVTQ